MLFCRFLILSVLFCSALIGKPTYKVGRDPTWYPLNFKEQTPYVNAFVNALVQQINLSEGITLELIASDTLSLLPGIEEGFYQGALTTLTPNLELTDLFEFSDPFLSTGPVLLVPKHSTATSLNDLKGKIVGVSQFSNSALIVQKYPTIVIHYFEAFPKALQDLASNQMDGVLVPYLTAHTLIRDGFGKTVKIVSEPLNQEGLRLVALKDQEEKLIFSFNKGIRKLQQNGQYARLLRRFLKI